MPDPRELLQPVLVLHAALREQVLAATEREAAEALARVSRDDPADTIYAIDVVADTALERFAEQLATTQSFVLIAEGIPEGQQVWPRGTDDSAAAWRIIVDPIDGTRGLMYQKRSAWILTAIAPNRGAATSLQDVVLAVQTEIPLVKQHLADQLIAIAGTDVTALRHNRITGVTTPLALRPSTETTIAHGYSTIVRFFPGGREALAAIDDDIVRGALGESSGKALCFEDQYASTGGQLYELLAGHDRFIADLRPLAGRASRAQPHCCHPYDICTARIAADRGVIITDAHGQPLDVPLDVETDVAWIGYANTHIRSQIEPLLQAALRARGWV